MWDEAARSVQIKATAEPTAGVNLEYLMLALKASKLLPLEAFEAFSGLSWAVLGASQRFSGHRVVEIEREQRWNAVRCGTMLVGSLSSR